MSFLNNKVLRLLKDDQMGWVECACGIRTLAPLEVVDGDQLWCDGCGREYIGVSDDAHGYWQRVPRPPKDPI